ncbi:MAG: right-handed parallel beta-helix repeat-containing protein, partial [Planctomycetota bacterium]
EEFKSLKPNFKTDVEVEGAKGRSESQVRRRPDIQTKRKKIVKKLQALTEQQDNVQRDLDLAEKALNEVRMASGFTDLEERSYPHPVTERLNRLQQQRDDLVLEISEARARTVMLEKWPQTPERKVELESAKVSLTVLQHKLKELDKMVGEAAARKRDLDVARVAYRQRAAIRDERKETLDAIRAQIEKLRLEYSNPEAFDAEVPSTNVGPKYKSDALDEIVYGQLEQTVELSELKADMAFAEAIEELKHSVEPPLKIIVMWRDVFDNADIDQTTPINMDAIPAVRLGRGLELVLEAVSGGFAELGFAVEDGVITIATKGWLSSKLETRVYDISKLVSTGNEAAGVSRLIENTVEPNSWYNAGGKGTIAIYNDRERKLVIYQTYEAHSQIKKLLNGLRANSPVKAEQVRQANSNPGHDEPVNLQQLIDSARRGSAVTIPKGVYTEPVTISKSLVLKGASRDDCIFEVTADGPAIFVDTKGKAKVVIEGITVKWQLATSGKKDEYPYAVAVKDSKAEVKNCSFVPLGNFKRCPTAIRAVGFSELLIDGCRFDGFEYTVCYGEGTEGTIQDCVITASGHQGISLYEAAKVRIERNIVAGSKYHGVRSTGGTLFMKDNLIINNDNRGVYLGNKSARGIISNNVIMGNECGISGFAESNVTIKNNVITDSSYAGIQMANSSTLAIGRNIICNSERGLILSGEGDKNDNSVLKNTFWKNKIDAENFARPADSILAEPAFRDPGNGDFSLTGGKPLEQKQGLTNPESLWEIWQRHADKNGPLSVAESAGASG